jgi:hypothetical protein
MVTVVQQRTRCGNIEVDPAVLEPVATPKNASASSDRRALAIVAFADNWSPEYGWNAQRFSDQVSSYGVKVVKTGNPNRENLPEWMSFDPNRSTTMALCIKPEAREIAGKARPQFGRESPGTSPQPNHMDSLRTK